MKRALVIGASGGIGTAVSHELASRRYDLTGLSRRVDGLDVTNEASIQSHLGHLEGPFDLILVATGALEPGGHAPEKAVREITPEAMEAAFRINAIGPMIILKHSLRLISKDTPAIFAALSARVASIGDNGIGGWHSYRASKTALNQFIHGAAIELKRTHKNATAVCLHPGTVETAFTEKYAGRHKTVPPHEAATNLIDVMESLTPDQSGKFFDYAAREIPW
ncbi:MAG: SDR family NAD(P)-dependent oxidoreductase [Boseongicola sp.]|nr:SDR family NAD(P)-dependent oxidoreductase [Boseongicola sp.]